MARRLTSSLLLAFMLFVLVAPIVRAGLEGEANNDIGGAAAFVNGAAFSAGFSTTNTSPVQVAGSLVNTFLSLIGIVFIILIIYAGFKWMTAGGNEEQVNKARTTIINSVIGIAVVMGAFVLYKFIEGIL